MKGLLKLILVLLACLLLLPVLAGLVGIPMGAALAFAGLWGPGGVPAVGAAAVAFAFAALLVVAVLYFMGKALAALLQGASGGPDRAEAPEDARLMQDLHRGLSRLEDRVEALEVLLMDRARERTSARPGGRDGG